MQGGIFYCSQTCRINYILNMNGSVSARRTFSYSIIIQHGTHTYDMTFSCMVQYSLCHGVDIDTCDIVHWSVASYYRIAAYRTVFGCTIVLVLNVIRCF